MNDQFYENDQELHATKIKLIHLKDNSIPRGHVPLEEVFDQDDVPHKQNMLPIEVGVEDLNLGTLEKPKIVNISKSLSLKMKGKYAALMSQFSDVFAWEYSDMKMYGKSIIEHIVPLKLNQKPFAGI